MLIDSTLKFHGITLFSSNYEENKLTLSSDLLCGQLDST